MLSCSRDRLSTCITPNIAEFACETETNAPQTFNCSISFLLEFAIELCICMHILYVCMAASNAFIYVLFPHAHKYNINVIVHMVVFWDDKKD